MFQKPAHCVNAGVSQAVVTLQPLQK
jgi:hypothetical protein